MTGGAATVCGAGDDSTRARSAHRALRSGVDPPTGRAQWVTSSSLARGERDQSFQVANPGMCRSSTAAADGSERISANVAVFVYGMSIFLVERSGCVADRKEGSTVVCRLEREHPSGESGSHFR